MIRVPDFRNKANNTIKLVTQLFFGFLVHIKTMFTLIMQCIIIYYTIALCLKKVYILIQKTVLLKK